MTPSLQPDLDSELERLPHAALDRDSRLAKTRKIVAIIGNDRFETARQLLEVGCGAGVITSTLAQLGEGRLAVHGVDVIDSRVDRSGYDFELVSGTALPHQHACFDIVISNHVMEHVGNASDQLDHLKELRRVLAPGGIVYIAVPNRWRLMEPHFHLPFLSWLPHPACDRYVRLMGKGSHYDCAPPSHGQLMARFAEAGFLFESQTVRAVRETFQIEIRSSAIQSIGRMIPDWVLRVLMPVMPTYIFLLRAK